MLYRNYLAPFIGIITAWVGPASGQAIDRAAKYMRALTFDFILQTGTGLPETDNTFQILMGDIDNDGRPDLVAIKTSNTGTRSTEIHVLSGSSSFKKFAFQTGTGLPKIDTAQFEFLLSDWDGDGKLDLVAIKKHGTGTKSTEIHILSGASKFANFILQTGTALSETVDTFTFADGDYDSDKKPDIFAIKKSNTGSKSNEVHILRGSAGYKNYLLQTGTGLSETDSTFDFTVADWDRDGRPDLVVIKKSNTGLGKTEIHVLWGALNFQSSILQTATALPPTDSSFEFGVADWKHDGQLDLFAFKKNKTGTRSTEVHVLGG